MHPDRWSALWQRRDKAESLAKTSDVFTVSEGIKEKSRKENEKAETKKKTVNEVQEGRWAPGIPKHPSRDLVTSRVRYSAPRWDLHGCGRPHSQKAAR